DVVRHARRDQQGRPRRPAGGRLMCTESADGRRVAEGALALETGRRSLLKVAGAGGLGLAFSTAVGDAAAAAPRRTRRRAYVLVVDGCRPDEIDSGLMPNLAALRAGGRHFPRAQSLPIMETLSNHVMMMTGVR